jgi:hypothetical protein
MLAAAFLPSGLGNEISFWDIATPLKGSMFHFGRFHLFIYCSCQLYHLHVPLYGTGQLEQYPAILTNIIIVRDKSMVGRNF